MKDQTMTTERIDRDPNLEAALEEFNADCAALWNDLSGRPTEAWRIGPEQRRVMLMALAAPRMTPAGIAEFEQTLVQLQDMRRRLDVSAHRMQKSNRLMFWAVLFLSAMFAAQFAWSRKPVDLLQALLWGATFIGHLWLRRRYDKPPEPKS